MLSVENGVIYITHGDYARTPPFKIVAQDEQGHETEYELKTGDLLILTVRERPNHESPVLIQIESTDGIFTFQPEDTENVDTGVYSADIEIRRAEHPTKPETLWPVLKKGRSYDGKRSYKNFVIETEVT